MRCPSVTVLFKKNNLTINIKWPLFATILCIKTVLRKYLYFKK